MTNITRKNAVRLTAGCKVNLFLRIVCRRSDGYHELETLFLPLSEPNDTLHVGLRADGAGIRLTCSNPELEGGTNLIVKAYEAFGLRTGFTPGLDVHLEKRIPVGAGLGGGSADAAAFLAHLNAIAGEKALPEDELAALGARLGADVPYFLRHGLRGEPALARGIGEVLSPARVELGGYSLILVCPAEHVSTLWAYREWDRLHPEKTCAEARLPVLTAAVREASNAFCPETTILANDFEEAVFPGFPGLERIKGCLIELGAAHAVMSGSGAAIFALYRSAAAAQEACAILKRRFTVSSVFQFPCWGVAKW